MAERLALIGNGKWGQNYVNTIRRLQQVDLPQKYIKTRSYPDLLTKSDIDGVIIASPTNTHFEIAMEFLSKGFNLLI